MLSKVGAFVGLMSQVRLQVRGISLGISRLLVAFSLCGALCVTLMEGAYAKTAQVFPTLKLQSLEQAQKLTLPTLGKPAFLAIGFHPNTQPDLEKGMAQVQSNQKKYSLELQIYEIPVVEASKFPNNGVTRFFMKQQIRQKTFLNVVYPYFTDLRAFQSQLGLSATETMIFVLLDKTGHKVWTKKTLPTPSDIDLWKDLLK